MGRMVAVTGDTIEVQTAYGKMQIRRSDILSINFRENEGSPGAPPPTAKKTAPAVEEKLEGTTYTNFTGNFTLIVPIEWRISKDLREGTEAALAGLASGDNTRFLIVTQEKYAGSLESYKSLVELQAKRALSDYEKLADSQATIDGRLAPLFVFRGLSPKAQNLPIQFLVSIIPYEGEMVKLSGFCVEPMFNESQRMFEKIILSYKK